VYATKKCEVRDFAACYCGFQYFQDKLPKIVEGLTNAAVALERLGEADRAKQMYAVAIKKFPGSEKPLNSYINLLQMEAVTAFSKKEYQSAYKLYKEIVQHAPTIYDARINLGNIEESLRIFDEAIVTYQGAIAMDPTKVKAFNSICRLLLMEVSGGPAGRFDVTQERRLKAFSDAKYYCSKALEIDPEGHTPNMNLGMVYKDSLEFDSAIYYFEKALAAEPNDAVVLSNLATTMSRNDRVPEAVKLTKRLLKLAAASPALRQYEAITLYSLGTILSPFDRNSAEGFEGHKKGMEMGVDRGGSPEHPKQCKTKIKKGKDGNLIRTLRYNYLEADDAIVDEIDLVDAESAFGRNSAQFLGSSKTLKTSGVGEIPLKFVDKQTIAVTIDNVYVEGAGGTMYTDCEVYAVIGVNSDIPRDYKGTRNLETIHVHEPVVSLIHPSINNYYHWTAESASRFLLSLDYFIGEGGVGGLEPEARFLIPSKIESPFFHRFLEMFDIKLKHAPIVYEPSVAKRYHFDKLHRIDWVQLDTNDQDVSHQPDLWTDYLPSRTALQRLREGALQHQEERTANGLARKFPPVIYVARSGVREVQAQAILIESLEQRFGRNLYVMNLESGPDKPGALPSKPLTMQDQLDLFSTAQIIIGPHGAGLVNMVYAPSDVSVVEFPMKPQCNRCFGYIAMALNFDYWVVPEVTTFYHLKYQMSTKKAAAVMKTLDHIMETRGITQDLTQDIDEDGDHDEL
jgi:tetratricopeptide (TPR) repeat protein